MAGKGALLGKIAQWVAANPEKAKAIGKGVVNGLKKIFKGKPKG